MFHQLSLAVLDVQYVHSCMPRLTAVLRSAAGAPAVATTTSRLLSDIASPADASAQRLALLALGEIGRRTDLSANPQVRPPRPPC